MRHPIARTVPVAAAALTGAVVTVAIRGSGPVAAQPTLVPPSTAIVHRTDLAATVLTGGTLGYLPSPPVVNSLTGTYTWLPQPGAVITAGQTLYRVDNSPVVLMIGPVPAWRPFWLGMSDGPDVRQLQANLIASHFAEGLLSKPTGEFGWATEIAVERWQVARHLPVTGTITLGQVTFLPSPLLVGGMNAAVGEQAAPGTRPYQVSTGQRVVTVPLDPSLPPVSVGEAISIVLPSTTTTLGTITAIGPVPAPAATGAGTGSPAAAPAVTQQLTVRPDQPAATGTAPGVPVQVELPTQSVRNVLAVPVSALLALAGGGYGLEVVAPTGARHLVGVLTGLFAAGQVQVTGPGITAGTKVVVAQ